MDRIKFLNQLATTPCKFNLGAGVPPLDRFPNFNALENYQHFMQRQKDFPAHQYHKTEGLIGEIASEVFKKEKMQNLVSNQLMVTNGVQEAIAITCLLFFKEQLFCFDPYYPGFVDMARQINKAPKLISANDWETEIEQIPAGSLLYLSSDFSNPSGRRLSLNQRMFIAEKARSKNFYIFDDATYRPFYIDESIVPLASLAHAVSFSKILAPGLRMAINYFPIELIDSAISIKANLSLNCSGFIQAILGNWLIEQNFSLCNHLAPFRQELKEKQTFLDAQGIGFEGGFFVELTLPEKEINLEWCAALLDEEGVAVCPMRLFSDHTSAMNKIRLAVAKISLADLSKSISIIHNFAKK